MFRRMTAPNEPKLEFIFEGEKTTGKAGDTVAAALLAAGHDWFRETPVSGAARGPFCLMGSCFDCLVKIDGEQMQACMTQVRSGMIVERTPCVVSEPERLP